VLARSRSRANSHVDRRGKETKGGFSQAENRSGQVSASRWQDSEFCLNLPDREPDQFRPPDEPGMNTRARRLRGTGGRHRCQTSTVPLHDHRDEHLLSGTTRLERDDQQHKCITEITCVRLSRRIGFHPGRRQTRRLLVRSSCNNTNVIGDRSSSKSSISIKLIEFGQDRNRIFADRIVQ
jgi:hypothetical protein